MTMTIQKAEATLTVAVLVGLYLRGSAGEEREPWPVLGSK